MAFFVFTAWFFFDVAAYGIGFYSPVILSELGFDRHIRLIAEGGMIIAVGAIVGYVVAFGLAENIGRRYLTIVGFLVMTVLLFLGSFVRISGPLKLIPFFFLFVLFEQWVGGAVTLFYPAELFPTSVRSTVQGTSTAISRIGAIMGVVLFPLLQRVQLPGGIRILLPGRAGDSHSARAGDEEEEPGKDSAEHGRQRKTLNPRGPTAGLRDSGAPWKGFITQKP